MTAEQINSLQPGPETDRLVAECIGCGDHWYPPGAPQSGPTWDIAIKTIPNYSPGKEDWNLFEKHPPFSTDMNAAMFAAEKFGLFDYSQCGMSLGKYMTAEGYPAWSVYDAEEFYMRGEGYSLYEATTGPLAICRAILALKT